jgi:hypothetical protein
MNYVNEYNDSIEMEYRKIVGPLSGGYLPGAPFLFADNFFRGICQRRQNA